MYLMLRALHALNLFRIQNLQDHEEIGVWTGDGQTIVANHHSKGAVEYYADAEWGTLDFVDVEKSLASKLTDDDIGAILLCIDAKNKLKRLNLTHCYNVVGRGLEPLRFSAVLEQIDLGLVRTFEMPIAYSMMH